MRLNLERLDTSGLDLTWGADPAHERRVLLAATNGLRGVLSRTQDALRLSDVAANSLLVALLKLGFESFTIALQAEGTLSNLSGSYEQHSGRTDLELSAHSLHAPELVLHFETFEVRGTLRAENARLRIAGAERRIRADSLEIDDLVLSGAAAFTASRVLVKDVDVSWGTGGYVVRVGDLQIPSGGAEVGLARTPRIATGHEEQPPGRAAPNGSLVDWTLLDGLSGSLDVDTFVDMKVPVIGTRQATHPFRIAVESGSVNYRALEKNLSALEDSFLDFAVRQDALVLERGIPLLPTRGQGKPMLVWPLGPEDIELAGKDRVRLAVLPSGRRAPLDDSSASDERSSDSDDSNDENSKNDGSDFALRRLSLLNLQTLLRLEPVHPSERPLRDVSFEELFLQGTVHHRTEGEPPEGKLMGRLRALSGRVVHLPLGTSWLDVGTLRCGELAQLQVPFRGIHPERVTCELADLRATSLSLGNRRA